MALANCARCGKIFQRVEETFCPECVKFRKAELDKIHEWIQNNHAPKLENIEEEIGINEKTFTKYLLEGRIWSYNKVHAKCEVCRKAIPLQTKNVVCSNCSRSLKNAQPIVTKSEIAKSEMHVRKSDKYKD